jgi:hypothetical protein
MQSNAVEPAVVNAMQQRLVKVDLRKKLLIRREDAAQYDRITVSQNPRLPHLALTLRTGNYRGLFECGEWRRPSGLVARGLLARPGDAGITRLAFRRWKGF